MDPNLKPMEEHELQLGANREFNFGGMGNVVFGARYIRKDLKRTIEDVEASAEEEAK